MESCLAWMVCLGAFLTQLVVIGIDSSFGVIIGSLIHQLDSSTFTISWIQSTHSTFMFLFASISSVALKKFRFGSIIFTGTTLCCTSYLASAFIPNHVGLIISYGIIGGAGSGLLYTTANIACIYYLDTNKKIATGIAMSGGGLGTIAVSIFCHHINMKFGCVGYFIAIASISLISYLFVFFVFLLPKQRENDTPKWTESTF